MKTREQIEKLIEERTRDRPELEAELDVLDVTTILDVFSEGGGYVKVNASEVGEDAPKLAKEDWPGEFKS